MLIEGGQIANRQSQYKIKAIYSISVTGPLVSQYLLRNGPYGVESNSRLTPSSTDNKLVTSPLGGRLNMVTMSRRLTVMWPKVKWTLLVEADQKLRVERRDRS